MLASKLKYILLSLGIIFFSCRKDEIGKVEVLPIGTFPTGFGTVNVTDDNLYADLRWELGKMMFYDVAFSRDSSISCASCHKQEFAFGDNKVTTNGAFGRSGTRNVPSIANVAYFPYFLTEGGLNTLEKQVLVPIQEHNEFDLPMTELLGRLSKNQKYTELAIKAYGRELDPFVISRAISNFERTLLSYRSKYDLWQVGEASLSKAETKGHELFNSARLACNLCHSGPLFTTFGFENNGLYITYENIGRKRLTGLDSDMARFKVPSLRNLGYTAPYMHDGSFATIDDVLEHYSSGGKEHQNKSHLVKPLNLSEKEKSDLKAFLLTLDDHELMKDDRFQ